MNENILITRISAIPKNSSLSRNWAWVQQVIILRNLTLKVDKQLRSGKLITHTFFTRVCQNPWLEKPWNLFPFSCTARQILIARVAKSMWNTGELNACKIWQLHQAAKQTAASVEIRRSNKCNMSTTISKSTNWKFCEVKLSFYYC